MRTKKGGFLRKMLSRMTKRMPRMSRSKRVQPSSMLQSSMLPTGIIEGIAGELTPQSRGQSRTKTPTQRKSEREARARARATARASRPKVASPEALEIIKQHQKTLAIIDNTSKEMKRLKAQSDANALEVMQRVREAQTELEGKKGGKKSRTRRRPRK